MSIDGWRAERKMNATPCHSFIEFRLCALEDVIRYLLFMYSHEEPYEQRLIGGGRNTHKHNLNALCIRNKSIYLRSIF